MRVCRSYLVGLLLLVSTPLYAQQKDSAALYDEALAAMRNKEFAAAIELFNQAQQAGMDQSSLYYNKGVALYRLARYPEARQAFQAAVPGADDVALIHYNLGLVSYRMGERSEARDWFRRAADEAQGTAVGRLADDMLERLDGKSSSSSLRKPWTVMADAALGYDDNVTLENSELAQGSDQSDIYLDIYASANYQFSGNRRNGLWAAVGISAIEYQDIDIYDTSQLDLGLYRDQEVADMQTRYGARLERIELGGSDYLQKLTLRLQAAKPIKQNQRLRLRYDLTRYDDLDSRYAYLAGLRHKIKLDNTWRTGGRSLKLGYGLELNDRDDLQRGTSFTSYSATRHDFLVAYRFPLNSVWHAKLGGDYRLSTYNDANIVAGVQDITREDKRLILEVELVYRLNKNVDLVGGYRTTDNNSNDLSRDYQRAQWSVGVQSYF